MSHERTNLVAGGVLDVDNVEVAVVLLVVNKNADTAGVTSTSHQHLGASVELDEVDDFAGLQVNLDGVADLDAWVGVADGACVVGNNDRDTLLCKQPRVSTGVG